MVVLMYFVFITVYTKLCLFYFRVFWCSTVIRRNVICLVKEIM